MATEATVQQTTVQQATAAVQPQQQVETEEQRRKRERNKPVKFEVNGKEVTLSINTVKNYLVTGDAAKVEDKDVVQFINLCRFNQLNPFLKEAFLVKYGSSPAQMIVSKEAFLKRAYSDPNYNGLTAGIIVQRGEEVLEVEGSFRLPTDVLLGGWAKVYHKGCCEPFVSKVSVKEFSKGQSTWNTMPATMIRKVAVVQALREAFPTQLGAMYVQEEQHIQDAEYEEVGKPNLEDLAAQAAQTAEG